MFYFLNKNVKFLRNSKGFTQQELADMLKIKKHALANFEGGTRNTSLEVLDKLHNIFNISLDELIYKDLSKGE